MALAIKFEPMVRDGEVKDYAEIARLGHVTRPRITQIMNLLNLAPDIQEQVLFLSVANEGGKERVTERIVRTVAKESCWGQQRGVWSQLA